LDDADRIGKKAIQLFEQLRLDYLNEEECKALWTSLTGEEPNDDRIRALKILTGGNPRLLAIVATFAAGKSLKSLMESLTRLVDDNTEYFKRYLDELPPVERKVFTALLTLWDQATPSEVATAARVSVARASTMLHRLRQRGMVGEVKASGKTKWYQAAERMYNIYYLVRRRGDRLTRVEILVRFIVAVFGPEWAARVVLDEAVLLDPSAREDHDLALHRILELAPDAPTRQRILSELASKFAGVDASGPTTTDPDLERFLEVEAEVKNALVGRGITGFLEAESLMPKAEDAAGESPEAWVRIAHYWHRVFGEWEMAERAYEKALSLRPDRAELWAGLAEVRHRRLQSYEKAESAYREALQLNKDDASTWAELGDLLQDHLGRYDEAEQAYRQSLKRETDPWVYEQLARLYSDRMGRLDDAEQTLRYLVKLKPRYTRGWMSLAELLQDRRQDYGEAARVLRKATESSPKQSNLWGLLGNLLFYKMGLLEEAEEAYRRALEGRGYRWHAIVGLVRLLLKREGGAEEAFQIATKAFSQERPTRPRDERVLAHAKAHIANEFFENGQWAYLDQMETWTLDALKEEPNNPDFLATAACILAARGKVAESLDLGGRYLERAKQDDRFVHNTLQLFLEIAAAGSPKEALLLLQDSPKAAELEPLVIALQLHLREDVTAPVEMREVAEEIVKRIEKRRAVIELKSEGGEEVRQEEKA
jgi:tetratricopeptide (TPR) repeat protein